MIIKLNLLLLSLLMLNGCGQLIPPQPNDSRFVPVTPSPIYERKATDGAIYSEKSALAFFETPRARHIGDILTIRLVEKTDATKKATTKQKKENDADIKDPTIFGREVGSLLQRSLAFKYEGARNFNGEGESKQNNKLSGTISVTVSDVQANGNLVVRGEKWITLNQGREYIRLTGVVRPADITPDNTVTSDRVADARIAYSGTGQVADSNVMGWFSRVFWNFVYPY